MLDALALNRAAAGYGATHGVGALGPPDEVSGEGKVLLVDDEPAVLDGLTRALRGHYAVSTAVGGQAGLERIAKDGPFAVVVSDMRMPGMDGAAFLSAVRKVAPESVRVLLTGYADVDAAMAAVNDGQLFRFLAKPCPPEVLLQALEGAQEQYRLIRAERDALANVLRSSVKVLVQLLNLSDPDTFGQASVVARYTKHITKALAIEDPWRYELAAMLSQVGCLALTRESLARIRVGQEVAEEDRYLFLSHPQAGRALVASIPDLEDVAEMIGLQLEDPTESDPDPEIALGAAILRVGLAVFGLVSRGMTVRAASHQLEAEAHLDKRLLGALRDYEDDCDVEVVRMVAIDELRAGMILDEHLCLPNDAGRVEAATELSPIALARVREHADGDQLVEAVRVRVPTWMFPPTDRAGIPA